MKTYIPALIAFIVGLFALTVGVCFKIMHWPGAHLILTIGTSLEVIALILLIIALTKTAKNQ